MEPQVIFLIEFQSPLSTARRWANLRNSYVRIKRERRTKPYKINNSWAYLEVLKFLDPILSTYSSAPSYSQVPKMDEGHSATNSSQVYGLKTMLDNTESMSSDYMDDAKMENDAEEMLFTPSMAYFEGTVLNNNGSKPDSDLQSSSDFNHVYDNGDTHESLLLNGLTSLNDSMKKLIGQQQQQSKHFMKLSQFISEQQNNQLASQSDQSKGVNLNDKVSVFLEYSLKPLLETVSSDPIKFAKLQNKITQVVIDELESQKNLS